MEIELNGEAVALEPGATVADAVARTGADPEEGGIAVALDGEVVPRSDWPETQLADGRRVEVVRAIQGGAQEDRR